MPKFNSTCWVIFKQCGVRKSETSDQLTHCAFRAMPSDTIFCRVPLEFSPKKWRDNDFVRNVLRHFGRSWNLQWHLDRDHTTGYGSPFLLLQLKATNSNKRKKVSIQKIELHTLYVCRMTGWWSGWNRPKRMCGSGCTILMSFYRAKPCLKNHKKWALNFCAKIDKVLLENLFNNWK